MNTVFDYISRHPLVLVSLAVCLLLSIGLVYRRRRKIHIPLMLAAFAIDMAMVIYLEVRRGVVESIPQRDMSPLLAFHIAISVIVLGLYFCQVYTGYRRWKGRRSNWHYWAAWFLFPLRLLNFVTSIFVSQP